MKILALVKAAATRLWDSQAQRQRLAPDSLSDPGPVRPRVQISVTGDTVIARGEVATQEEKEKVLLTLGKITGGGDVEVHIRVMPPAGGQARTRFVRVKRGDTLATIAQAEYGSTAAVQRIFAANTPMLSHPDKIYPGQVLLLPEKFRLD